MPALPPIPAQPSHLDTALAPCPCPLPLRSFNLELKLSRAVVLLRSSRGRPLLELDVREGRCGMCTMVGCATNAWDNNCGAALFFCHLHLFP